LPHDFAGHPDVVALMKRGRVSSSVSSQLMSKIIEIGKLSMHICIPIPHTMPLIFEFASKSLIVFQEVVTQKNFPFHMPV
jgi:hypothetical protein